MEEQIDNFHWLALKTLDKQEVLRPRDTTSVAQIHSGWLIRFTHFHGKSSSLTSQTMSFIPDPDHSWQPELVVHKWEKLSRKANPNYGDMTDRMRVWNGWIYKNCFFNGNSEMHLSLAFIPGGGTP